MLVNRATKPKKPPKHKRDPLVDSTMLGVSGTGVARKNLTKRSNNRGGPALEVSANGGAPSRKSTRSSSGRVKLASNLTRRQTRKVHSGKERATRAAAARS